MEDKCPKCKVRLIEQEVYKVSNPTTANIIGFHLFCPNRNCNYESETYNNPRGESDGRKQIIILGE